MNIQKKRNNLPLVIAVAVIIIGGVGAYALIQSGIFGNNKQNTVSKTNYEAPTKEQVASGEEAKQRTIDNNAGSSTKGNVPTSSGTDSASLSVAITAASVSDDMLYIRSEIDGIYSDGSCTLTLKNGSKVVTKTAGIQALPQSSTCKGFNVPASELSDGTWSIALDVTAGNKTGKATSQVTI